MGSNPTLSVFLYRQSVVRDSQIVQDDWYDREIYFYTIYLYYDNYWLDPSEEYFRKKKKGNDEDTYFPPEESEPPHY